MATPSTTVNVGPLTTFTPASSCTALTLQFVSTITNSDVGGNVVRFGLGYGPQCDDNASDCYPKAFLAYKKFAQPVYSPGTACPTGWGAACTMVKTPNRSLETMGDVRTWDALEAEQTAIACCPHGYKCDTSGPDVCISMASKGATIQAFQSTICSSTIDGSRPTAPAKYVLGPQTEAPARAPQIRFILPPSAALPIPNSLLTAASLPKPEVTGPNEPDPTSGGAPSDGVSSSQHNGELSLGAKVGIGMGAAAALLLIVALAILLFKRKNKRKLEKAQGNELYPLDGKSESYGTTPRTGREGAFSPTSELDGFSSRMAPSMMSYKSNHNKSLPDLPTERTLPHIAELAGDLVPELPVPTTTSPAIADSGDASPVIPQALYGERTWNSDAIKTSGKKRHVH